MKQILTFPANLNKKDGAPVVIDHLEFLAKARFEGNYATLDYCGEVVRVDITAYEVQTLTAEEAQAAVALNYAQEEAPAAPAVEVAAAAAIASANTPPPAAAPAEAKPPKDNAKLKEYTALKKFAKEKGIPVPKGTSLEDLKKLLEESK